jgi:hypothetical protein
LSVGHKKDVVIAATVLFERLPIRQDDVPQQLMTLQRNLSRKTDSTLLRDSNLTAIDLLIANDFRDAMSTVW